MRTLKVVLTLFVLYAVAALPEFLFLMANRTIVQPATPDAVEVFVERPGTLDEPYDARIEPFNHALALADERAEAHPEDLAPPYLLRHPWRLVAPYVSSRGHELAAAPLRGVAWPNQVRTPFVISPEVWQVRHSVAKLNALMSADRGPLDDPRIFAASIDAERDMVVVVANAIDQPLRRLLARTYGADLVALQWDPWAKRLERLAAGSG